MRRKFPTSAWRRSVSSTKRTPETPSRAYKSLFEAAAAAADMAAEAAFEAAAAVFEAAAAAFEAAALAFAAAEAAALDFEAAALAAAVAAAAAGAGAGAAAAAFRGEAAPSARRKRLASTLTEAGVMPGFDRVWTRPAILFVARPGRCGPPACEEQPNRWRTDRETLAGELDDGALAENTPCTGVRSCGKVRVLTS